METTLKFSRRNPRPRKRRGHRVTIPDRVSPHVKLVFSEMRRQAITYDEVADGSGVLRTTIKAWRTKNAPGLASIEAVMGFLGWDFIAVPRERVLPPDLVAELRPVADKLATTMPATVEALVAIVAGIHDRFAADAPPTAPSLAELTAA